jgi:hypothetical protein
MNSENTHIKSDGRQVSTSVRSGRTLVLLGAVAAMAITLACSSNSKPVVSSSRLAVSPSARPAALQTVEPAAPHVAAVAAASTNSQAEKPPASTLYLFRSRDYGVSFHYPWQYAYLSAKSVANGDSSLQPRSDGHDGQFTLARIEIPKGFYPDTDFESGYFSLSLNQGLDQQQCESVLPLGPDGTVGTDTISGVDFRWIETDSGGRGSALKLRNYVTFTNGICYELEMGVKTSNQDGLARELDPGQVMRRLEAILRSVTILPATRNPAAPPVETSTAAPAPMPQN